MDAKKFRILRAVLAWVAVAAVAAALILANFMANRYANLISVLFKYAETKKLLRLKNENTRHFASDYDSEEAMKAHLQEIGKQIEAEGAVLLENNGTLPLNDAGKNHHFRTGQCGSGLRRRRRRLCRCINSDRFVRRH